MSFDYKRWKEQQYSAASDAPVPEEAKGCPRVIFLVGLIWSAFGFCQLLFVLFYFLKTRETTPFGLAPWAVMHLICGVKLLSGTLPGTIRAACFNIFWGIMWTVVAGLCAEAAMTNPNPRPYALLMCLGLGVAGGLLLLSGGLAIIYSETYQRWRDPWGAAARARSAARSDDPTQEQREARPTRRRRERAPKSSIPVWVGGLVGVLLTMFIFGAFLVAPSFAPNNNTKPSATIESYGRYSSQGQTRTETNRHASGGATIADDDGVVLLEQTDQILCKVGERWGIEIHSSNLPTNRSYMVRQETYHPPIKQPDGSVLTKSISEFKVREGKAPHQFYGWYFLKGYEYELVAGEWRIVVFIDGVEVARQSFHIRK